VVQEADLNLIEGDVVELTDPCPVVDPIPFRRLNGVYQIMQARDPSRSPQKVPNTKPKRLKKVGFKFGVYKSLVSYEC
jgi:hypothetical protein